MSEVGGAFLYSAGPCLQHKIPFQCLIESFHLKNSGAIFARLGMTSTKEYIFGKEFYLTFLVLCESAKLFCNFFRN